jgi:hypothetical protein
MKNLSGGEMLAFATFLHTYAEMFDKKGAQMIEEHRKINNCFDSPTSNCEGIYENW